MCVCGVCVCVVCVHVCVRVRVCIRTTKSVCVTERSECVFVCTRVCTCTRVRLHTSAKTQMSMHVHVYNCTSHLPLTPCVEHLVEACQAVGAYQESFREGALSPVVMSLVVLERKQTMYENEVDTRVNHRISKP